MRNTGSPYMDKGNLRTFLTLSLMTGYKMYPGLVFSSTVLGGTEQQSYSFFYLFSDVPLTNNYHYAASRLFF